MPARKPQYKITSLERAIALLNALRDSGELGLTEIASRTKMFKASALRTIRVLCDEGLIYRQEHSGKYKLSFRTIALSEAAKRSGGLIAEAKPVMRRIHSELGEAIYLSVRHGDYRNDIYKIDGRNEQRRIINLETSKPLYRGAPSLLFASSMTDIEINQMLSRIAPPNCPVTQFHKSIRLIRRQGFSVSTVTGGAVSAAIIDRANRVIAALTVSVPLSAYPTISGILQRAIVEGAREISKALIDHANGLMDIR